MLLFYSERRENVMPIDFNTNLIAYNPTRIFNNFSAQHRFISFKAQPSDTFEKQVKVKNNTRTNIIVNVNMEDSPGVIRIDDAILYNFVEEWQF